MNHLKKFTNIKTVSDIMIKSDIGYIPVKNMMKTIEYDVYLVKFSDSTHLKCADNHILIDENDNELFVADLVPNKNKIKAKNGNLVYVTSIQKLPEKKQMYDLQLQYHHKFYTNNVLSHNTTVVAAYIAHQMTFRPEYKTAVLAHKLSASREVLSRVKLMYEELPWFLQMGVSEWNKGSIELGNKSQVFSAAAGSSSIRGKSVNCVDINTKVTVKNRATGEVETLTIAELENRIGNP